MNNYMPPQVDPAQISQFVHTLFRYADEDTFISLRAFDQFARGVPPILIQAIRVGPDLDSVVTAAVQAAQRSAQTASPSVFAPPIATFTNPDRARGVDLANGIVLSIDIDENPATGQTTLEQILGPVTMAVESGSEWTDPETGEMVPKRHLHWRLSEPTRDPADHDRLVFARRFAQQIIGADPTGTPVVHPLRWPGSLNTKAAPRLARIAQLHEGTEIHLIEALELLEDAAAGLDGDDQAKSDKPASDITPPSLMLVADALCHIPNHAPGVHYGDWIRFGYAMWRAADDAGEHPDAGFRAWNDWSQKSEKYDAGETESAWSRIGAAITGTKPARRISARTIFKEARKHGWKPTKAQIKEPIARSDTDDATAPYCTDDALALKFSERHADQLRHVAMWGKWLQWTGTYWQPDPTLATFDRARAVCREAAVHCKDPSLAAKVSSAATVAAVERLARADRRHAATTDQWDADPWLLNTPGGVVDLRTGKMRRHRPDDYQTKITAISPSGDCLLWRAFLARATNNDPDLQAYLQRVAGYSLTGNIREHALFFAFGTGANGKGVFINTLTGIMASYAAVSDMATFTASQADRHPTDLAMLRGARLVTAQETEEGRRWAESRIKAMTGGDPITARFMRQDFFTFEPSFKLLIAGNHRPGLRGVDEPIRRRFHLIPFAVKIPATERDKDLPEKLKAEWPGILKWAIAGCLEWQGVGLAPPAAVVSATAEYLDAEDAAANWIAECCTEHPQFHTSASALFASWKAWAEAAGEFVGPQKAFSQKLIAKGFEAKRMTAGKSGFVGLALNSPPQRCGETE